MWIDLVDDVDYLMFVFGMIVLDFEVSDLIGKIVGLICVLFNIIMICGYIDSVFYGDLCVMNNWMLLLGCVEVMCCCLLFGGMLEVWFEWIEGVVDCELLIV